jgi:hypothetical protein
MYKTEKCYKRRILVNTAAPVVVLTAEVSINFLLLGVRCGFGTRFASLPYM